MGLHNKCHVSLTEKKFEKFIRTEIDSFLITVMFLIFAEKQIRFSVETRLGFEHEPKPFSASKPETGFL